MKENIREQFKFLDKKFLVSVFVGIFLPLIYSFLRTLFIINHGANSYAMASYWAYIQIFLEISGAFLILPLFTFSKKHQSKKSFSILMGVIAVLLILAIILFSITAPLLNSMESMNTDENVTRKMLRNFLWLSMVSNILIIYEEFMMADVITERNPNKVYIFTAISLILKISLDLLFLSPFSPITYSINNIAFSQLISSFLIIVFLQVMWVISYKKDNNELTFSKDELFDYYKRGIIPGTETLIRNFFYAFVTLKIVNSLGETQWNSWHLAGWVYWHILFKFTIMLEYILLSERINNKNIDARKLTYLFISIDALIFIIVGPISIIFILPTIVDDSNWLQLTTQTAWIMMPFMFMMGVQNKFRTKFLVENKLKYILINTTITNILIEFPVFILLLANVHISYTWNLIIWLSAVTFSFSIALYQFEFLKSKSEKIKINSTETIQESKASVYAKNDKE